MIGSKFGCLTVLEFVNVTNRHRNYLCKCDCGNTKVIRGTSLTSGNTISCGCVQIKRATEIAINASKNNGNITRQKQVNNILNKNNKSGVPGVSYSTYDKRWRVDVRYNGIKYSKKFSSFDDAVAWRKKLATELGMYDNLEREEKINND